MKTLKLNWCTFEAADFAVRHWHYSKAMPQSKLIKIGVWEDNIFIGCVLFGRGANNNLLKPYGLEVTEGCELVRIALKEHEHTVTEIVSIAIRLLKKSNPGLKLIISFADQRQQHLGKIYQAGNWIYTGVLHSTPDYFYRGRWAHQRTLNQALERHAITREEYKKFPVRDGGYRYRYLYPLTEEMKKKVLPLKKDYPKNLPTESKPLETNLLNGNIELSSNFI